MRGWTLPQQLPHPASLHLAAALEGLTLADESLDLAIDATLDEAVAGGARRGPTMGQLEAIRAAGRLFRSVLAPAAEPTRLPASVGAFLRDAAAISERPDLLPGLERAACALAFASGALEGVIDAIPASEWAWHCLGASHCLARLVSEIEDTIRKRPPAGNGPSAET